MTTAFDSIRDYASRLGLAVTHEDTSDELLVVDAPEQGIHQLILDCEDSILVIEQCIADLPAANADTYRRLLQINRSLVHGALCLSEDSDRLIFRDTLALENLDFNELESSINALSLMLAEYSGELIEFAQQGD